MANLLYHEEADCLSLELEDNEEGLPLFSINLIRDLVELNIHPSNGRMVSIEINGLYKSVEGILPEMNDFWYSEFEDTLYIHLCEEDKDTPPMCDMAYHDPLKKILVTLNRNKVGNLVGLEVNGVTEIIAPHYDD